MKKQLFVLLVISTLTACGDSSDSIDSVDGIKTPNSNQPIGVEGGHAGAGFASLAIYANNELAASKKSD